MTSSNSPDFDSRRFKRIERDGYNLIAQRYADAAGLRAALTEALLDAANLSAGQALLDLASGPGVLAQPALARVAPEGWVVASDLAEKILAVGRAACDRILYTAADAEVLPFRSAAFDRVLCGLGLMFFTDEQRALAEMNRVLRPGGRIALSVWGAAEQVPLIECALSCMRRLLPAPKVARPSVFRLGSVLPGLLAASGFGGIRIESCELVCRFACAGDYWQAFLDLAGGAAGSLARLPAETQAGLAGEVARELAPYREGQGFRLASTVLIATAAKGG